MDVVVRGKNVEVPSRVRATTEEKLAKLARFAPDLERVEVDFSEVRNPRVADAQLCEVTLQLRRHVVKAHAASTEATAALDLTVDKLRHQLERLKDKRLHRSRRSRLHAGVAPHIDEEGDDLGDQEALIVKTKRVDLKPMLPVEAALQMELLGHAFYLFSNSENGRAAVLYRRRDGHLGLIESV